MKKLEREQVHYFALSIFHEQAIEAQSYCYGGKTIGNLSDNVCHVKAIFNASGTVNLICVDKVRSEMWCVAKTGDCTADKQCSWCGAEGYIETKCLLKVRFSTKSSEVEIYYSLEDNLLKKLLSHLQPKDNIIIFQNISDSWICCVGVLLLCLLTYTGTGGAALKLCWPSSSSSSSFCFIIIFIWFISTWWQGYESALAGHLDQHPSPSSFHGFEHLRRSEHGCAWQGAIVICRALKIEHKIGPPNLQDDFALFPLSCPFLPPSSSPIYVL